MGRVVAGARWVSIADSIRFWSVSNFVLKSLSVALGLSLIPIRLSMPTLDQVSKRVFSDSSWLIKCLIGGLLCLIPVANIWSLGVFYRLADQGRRGESVRLPEWDNWTRLFLEGLQYLLLLIVLGILPIVIGVLIFTGQFTVIARWLTPYLPVL